MKEEISMLYSEKVNKKLNKGGKMINEINSLLKDGSPKSKIKASKIKKRLDKLGIDRLYLIQRAETLRG